MSLLQRILHALGLLPQPEDDPFVRELIAKRQASERELRKHGVDPNWDISTIQDILEGRQGGHQP